jgi:hypothetical protein
MRATKRNKNFWTLTDAGRILYEVIRVEKERRGSIP